MPATASRALSRRSDGGGAAAVRDQRLRVAAHDPARAAGACARRARGSIVNVCSMGGRLTFPAAAPTTRPSTRSKRSPTRCASRSRLRHRRHLIEPGAIKTEFGSTAAGVASAEDDPYADFNRAVAKSTRDVYEGLLSRLGGDADSVARAIERALGKSRAPTRVPVHGLRARDDGPAAGAARPGLGPGRRRRLSQLNGPPSASSPPRTTDLRTGRRRAARGPQEDALDVVRLPADRRPRP